MKKLLLLVCCALALPLSIPAQEAPTTVVEKYADRTINGVIIAGAFDVQLAQADGASRKVGAKVEVQQELADKLVFEYTDEGYVRLSFKNDVSKYFTGSKKKPQAWITVSELKYLNVTGASSVVCTGICSTEGTLRLLTSGASSVHLLETSAESAHIEIGGASEVSDAKLTVAGEAVAEVSGTSKLSGTVKCGDAKFVVSGVSGVTLAGEATKAEVEVSGTGAADLEHFVVGTMTAKVSGMGKVKANVTQGGAAEVSTMSSFRYTGTGLVTGKGVKRID